MNSITGKDLGEFSSPCFFSAYYPVIKKIPFSRRVRGYWSGAYNSGCPYHPHECHYFGDISKNSESSDPKEHSSLLFLYRNSTFSFQESIRLGRKKSCAGKNDYVNHAISL